MLIRVLSIKEPTNEVRNCKSGSISRALSKVPCLFNEMAGCFEITGRNIRKGYRYSVIVLM